MTDLVRASAAALAALALAGCGGSAAGSQDRDKDAQQTSAAAASDSTASPGSTGRVSTGATAGPAAAGASAGPAASTAPAPAVVPASPAPRTSPAPTPTHIVLDAALSAACVTPGGSMTLTIRNARPGMQVIFNTTYSDGKDGTVHGGFDSEGRRTTSDGGYTKSWVVEPLTPTGQAELRVGAVDNLGYGDRTLTFQVARSCG